MIEMLGVDQFVDEHVAAGPRRGKKQAHIERQAAAGRTAAPARALIADSDSAEAKTMALGQFADLARQHKSGTALQPGTQASGDRGIQIGPLVGLGQTQRNPAMTDLLETDRCAAAGTAMLAPSGRTDRFVLDLPDFVDRR